MRILYVTTVGSTMYFFTDLIRSLLDKGHTVDVACNAKLKPIIPCYERWGCRIYPLSCTRSPFSLNSLRTVREIRTIVSQGHYDIVHCHTPVASACTRIACRALRKKGLRVIYTSHGFHFYKGAPLKNWLLYYPIEKLCAGFTDVLITINREDLQMAKRLGAKQTLQLPGVGINVEKFRNATVDVEARRAELGIPKDAFVLISAGELNRNKNQQVVIRAIELLNDPEIYYLIAGIGPEKSHLAALAAQAGLSSRVLLLGFRSDLPELYKCADAVVFPSVREGLGLVSVEGMAAGLPVICADNRGTREYSALYREEGLVCPAEDAGAFARAILRLKQEPELRARLQRRGPEIAEAFSVDKVISLMEEIYFGAASAGDADRQGG